MEPISAAIGLGLGIAGLFGSSDAADRAAKEQKAIAADQIKIEGQKRQAMELDARRRELEVFRSVQRARSIALTNATLQGGQFGSGVIGGMAQATQAGHEDLKSIGQNLTIGRTISDLNNDISQHKMSLADIGADQAFWSGLSSLGGTILGQTNNIGKISSGWGSK